MEELKEGEREDVRKGGTGLAPIFSRCGRLVVTIGVTGKEERRRGIKESIFLACG